MSDVRACMSEWECKACVANENAYHAVDSHTARTNMCTCVLYIAKIGAGAARLIKRHLL